MTTTEFWKIIEKSKRGIESADDLVADLDQALAA